MALKSGLRKGVKMTLGNANQSADTGRMPAARASLIASAIDERTASQLSEKT